MEHSEKEFSYGDRPTRLIDEFIEKPANRQHQTKIDIKTLENWLWDAACSIRGPVDAPKFKDYILPLVFVKRLSDVFEDEIARISEQFGNVEFAYVMDLMDD